MTESQLQDAIIQLAQTAGYRVVHFRPARTAKGWRTAVQGDAGFPDLIICGHGRFIVAEIKTSRGTVTPAQCVWLQSLVLANVETYIWRPIDWERGSIAKFLGCADRVIRRDKDKP